MNNEYGAVKEKENVLAGTVGALLFSLVGGILWFVLYQFGFIAAISGLVGVICSIKGYSIFAKKESLKGIVIAIVAAVLVMVVAWYMCLSKDVYDTYKEWYENGEIDYYISFSMAVRRSYVFLEDSEVAIAYFKDLAIGLVLCIVGAFRFVVNAVQRVKQEKKNAQNQLETQADFNVTQTGFQSEGQPIPQPIPQPVTQGEWQSVPQPVTQSEVQPKPQTETNPETPPEE